MSEFKGTKGAVKIVKREKGLSRGIYLSGENQKYFLAEIITHERTDEENMANAVLYSKALEMLEFIKKYYRYLNLKDQETAEQLIKEATEL